MKRQILLNASMLTVLAAIAGFASLEAVKADTMVKPMMEPTMSMKKMERPIVSGQSIDQFVGQFVASEHPTAGMVMVVSMNGQKYLKFDSTFKSDSGPDLYVLLHRQEMPKDYKKDNYINLGRLQKVAGSQMYAIPADTDISAFKTAVIWCRQFNATFGFATLKSV